MSTEQREVRPGDQLVVTQQAGVLRAFEFIRTTGPNGECEFLVSKVNPPSNLSYWDVVTVIATSTYKRETFSSLMVFCLKSDMKVGWYVYSSDAVDWRDCSFEFAENVTKEALDAEFKKVWGINPNGRR